MGLQDPQWQTAPRQAGSERVSAVPRRKKTKLNSRKHYLQGNVHFMRLFSLLLCPLILSAAPWIVGASGAPGTQSCASSCHGDGTGTVEVHGFPESYVPDSSYIVQLTSTGLTIANFNASCRVGTSSLNAGVIFGQGMTATYSVPNETNGVHATTLYQDTLEYRWRAPTFGTGQVRMYVAAHQGQDTGPNTQIMLAASETIVPRPPDIPGRPFPADSATDISVTTQLHWDEVARADSFRVFFGTMSVPPLVATQTLISYSPDTLLFDTQYFWRIEAFNDVGTTSGPEWSFTTGQFVSVSPSLVGDFTLYPPYPNPFNGSTSIRMDLLGNVPLAIQVYDVQGRLVETLYDGLSRHGLNEFVWQARGGAGVYFIRAEVNYLPTVFKTLFLK